MFGRQLAVKVDSVLALVRTIVGKLDKMANELENLRAAVAQTKSIEQSSLVLIQGMASRMNTLAAASPSGVDPAAVQALADELMNSSGPLAAAITANTPADAGAAGAAA